MACSSFFCRTSKGLKNKVTLFSVILWITFSVIGYYLNRTSLIESKISQTISVNDPFRFLLLSNLKVWFTMTILGALTLGSLTLVNLILNSINFGYLLKWAVFKGDLHSFLILVLPHGIFEIPAIIIAGAAGFKIPYEIIRYLMGKKEQPLTKDDIKEYLTLALISIILIVIAAWIEANVTLKIAEAMLKKGT